MKEVFLAAVFAIASTIAFVALPATAFASDTEDVALCAAALDARGVAAADAFRPKFLKSKGAAVRRVSVLMIPYSGDAASIEAECAIKRGEVVDVAVKA